MDENSKTYLYLGGGLLVLVVLYLALRRSGGVASTLVPIPSGQGGGSDLGRAQLGAGAFSSLVGLAGLEAQQSGLTERSRAAGQTQLSLAGLQSQTATTLAGIQSQTQQRIAELQSQTALGVANSQFASQIAAQDARNALARNSALFSGLASGISQFLGALGRSVSGRAAGGGGATSGGGSSGGTVGIPSRPQNTSPGAIARARELLYGSPIEGIGPAFPVVSTAFPEPRDLSFWGPTYAGGPLEAIFGPVGSSSGFGEPLFGSELPYSSYDPINFADYLIRPSSGGGIPGDYIPSFEE